MMITPLAIAGVLAAADASQVRRERSEAPTGQNLRSATRRYRRQQRYRSLQADDTCSFCPGGVIDPGLSLPGPEEVTCGQAAEYAALLSVDDEICPTVQMGEMLCCPAGTEMMDEAVEEDSGGPTLDASMSLPSQSVLFDEEGDAASEQRQPTVSPTSDDIFVEAVIVGAGWAGISTAIDLQNRGYSSLLILEANDYVGGRSKTNNSDGTLNAPPADLPSSNVPIEMGSEWLYQKHSQYSYLQSGGFLSNVDTTTISHMQLGTNSLTAFYQQTGSSPGQSQPVPDTQVDSLENDPWRSYNSFKSSCSSSHEQCKQAYFNSQSLSSLQRQYLNLIIDASGGLETSAEIDELPTSKNFAPDDDEKDVPTVYMSPQGVGFGNTAAAVAEQLNDKIRLNSKVIEIDTSSIPEKVIVTYEVANSGSEVRVIANSVAVTVSLNVLKANNINFIPQLPSWKQDVINGMGMGVLNKCVFVWNDEAVAQLYPDKFWIEFISDQDATSGRWTTFFNPSALKGKPTLVGWVAGEEAMRMEDQTDDEVKAEMMSNLKLMFPNIPEPDRVVITRWGKEPNVLGGYSHYTVGRDFASDSSTLGLPVGRIIFAGEAAAGSWYSTTLGAWSTGQRAANEMKQYLTSWSTIPTWSPIVASKIPTWSPTVQPGSRSMSNSQYRLSYSNRTMSIIAVSILYFWRL